MDSFTACDILFTNGRPRNIEMYIIVTGILSNSI